MNDKLYKLMNWPRIEGIIYSEEDNPHEVLGPHITGKSVLFQTFQPGASGVFVIAESENKKYKMEMVDESGYFACLAAGKIPEHYEYEVQYGKKESVRVKDAYRYHVGLTENDIDKFNAGIHYTIYEKLGTHLMTVDGVEGTFFAVWAPNALRVSVVGDFNHWDGRVHQMKRSKDGGIFEMFIPDVKPGECYKFEIKAKGGLTYLKADPYAFGQQLRPENASIVRDISGYKWKDKKWIGEREKNQQENSPISVFEMYLGSFRRNKDTDEYLNYRELAPEVVKYVKEMGYTHVELLPIMEHPLDASWGYQVIGYYAPTARYGTAEDFMYFVDTLHQAGIGVILDWVPAHFPRDTYGLSQFDGTCLYEHADPRQGAHPHWGTLIYNYGRPQVSNYLIANALYWVEKYHIDAIRMDAVASMLYLDYGKRDGEWVANIYGGNENLQAIELLKHLNSVMKKRNPGVLMIAEESTAWPKITGKLEDDGLGFDIKWNMGFMNDFINYISYDPYFRAHHHNELTFSMVYAYSENFMLVFSHDEVVHGKSTMVGKMPGVLEDKFANLRISYTYMMTHPGKKLLFMGQDIGEFREFDETRETEWSLIQHEPHKGLNRLVKDLNSLYRKKSALHALDTSPEGFEWINCISPEKCMVSFLRKAEKKEEVLVVVVNFANTAQKFVIGVPYEGKYKEILNTDAKCYGGLGRVNSDVIFVMEEEVDGKPYSFTMESAPLSASIFSYIPYTEKEKEQIERKKAVLAAELRAEEAKCEAEVAKEEAAKARQEAENANKLAREAMDRAREAEKKAVEEVKKAQEEMKRVEKLRREAEIKSSNI
ncbi:1,4-alpha-glucan branching protein GlgB [Parablautia intestinalis]|uniref:1,4-alpha-glucan branching protein GlgB n=1 Tax=Parablautia intestinalis TaxID=2320100 RepID=UPI00259C6F8E|nr:1,4-alpha-glucan branching protein GlgB [Parablautia intestinalis]